MIKYNFDGTDYILKKDRYTDGHLCISITDTEGNYVDRLSTNFSPKDCEKHLGKDLKENEILICMTPSIEHPLVRAMTMNIVDDGLFMCMYDFIRTYNEYYRYRIFTKTMEMLESKEIIEFIPEEYEEEEND